jgi:hypothetical protein
MRFHPAPFLLAALGCSPALADTLEAVRACTPLASDRERLACYDAAVGRVPTDVAAQREIAPATPVATAPVAGTPPAAPVPAPTASAGITAAAAATTKAEPVEDFGLSEQARREREGVVTTTSITARIESVGQTTDGRQAVTLDNDQMWVQLEASTRVRLRTGDEVTIRRAALGSFILTKPNSGSMRVRRER